MGDVLHMKSANVVQMMIYLIDVALGVHEGRETFSRTKKKMIRIASL
jgi:hypothetical protein